MPTPNRVRSNAKQRVLLALHSTGQENDVGAIGLRQARSFDRAGEDEELRAEQQVFGD